MKLVLAPLAGFTDAPFRRLCREGGADFTYTEMVSAAALAHGSRPTLQLMERLEGEGETGCQIFGAKESDVAHAVAAVPAGFAEINLNAGCPMTKITREGAGAKLVEDPARIYRLIRAMRENTPLDVTLKTRLGPHPGLTNIFEIADAAEKAGAKGLTVHARYTSQMHGGEVHLELLREIVKRTSLPVTGNGSVTDAASLAAMAATGVEAVMIGRAALARPSIFRELKGCRDAGLTGVEACRRHLGLLLEFRRRLAERFPDCRIPGEDAFASVKMHTHLFRYFNGRPGAAALRARLNRVRTLAEVDMAIGDFEN
jgi:nifR3 family TIM-barrel protein